MLKYKEFFKEELKSAKNMTEIDAPPQQSTAQVQPAAEQSIDKGFMNYIKNAENAGKVGFKNGKWYPHVSPEGGRKTIGYGHKLTGKEDYSDGLTDGEIDNLLKQDLGDAEQIVNQTHEKWVEGYIKQLQAAAKKHPDDKKYQLIMSLKPDNQMFKLSTLQKQMLMDFAFNLGTLKSFPNFTKAVFRQDWKTAEKEYKRSYKDANGVSHELTRRNNLFFNNFLKNLV